MINKDIKFITPHKEGNKIFYAKYYSSVWDTDEIYISATDYETAEDILEKIPDNILTETLEEVEIN